MHKKLALALLLGAALVCAAYGQTINRSVQQSQDPTGTYGVDTNQNLYIQNNRHMLFSPNAAAPPTLGTCAGGTLVAGSTDVSGAVSGTTGTTCTVNFGAAYVTAPRCVVSGSTSSTTTGPVSSSTTTAALTMTVVATGAGTWSYFCSSNS